MEDARAVEDGLVKHGSLPTVCRDSGRSRNNAEITVAKGRPVWRQLKRSAAGVWYAANARVDGVPRGLLLLHYWKAIVRIAQRMGWHARGGGRPRMGSFFPGLRRERGIQDTWKCWRRCALVLVLWGVRMQISDEFAGG